MLALQILIDGFAISALYALGATGFTLIFGVSGVLNLSHGAIMVLAAVAAWAAASVLHVDTYSGALIGGGVEVEENDDHLIFVAGKFANLERTRVRGGFPIDVAGALQHFVGTDAVEIVARAATPGFDLAGDGIREAWRCSVQPGRISWWHGHGRIAYSGQTHH